MRDARTPTIVDDPLLDTAAAARLLGVNYWTLVEWRKRRPWELPHVRVGRLVKYRRSAIDRYLEMRTVGV